jgi:hypothetical protein
MESMFFSDPAKSTRDSTPSMTEGKEDDDDEEEEEEIDAGVLLM